ncbi:MAG TPA: AraC family transcriptional regulator [Kofleriaceae bacterium]|nr:AraC family transcriptional regulator [Kofleriaceae bacterium]
MSSSAAPQIAIQAIWPLLQVLRARGVDAAALCGELGLGDLALGDLHARLPLACLDRLWQRAAERLGDPDLGLHVAEAVQPDSFGLLSYLGTASATCGEGLERVIRYFRLLSDGSRYQLDVSAGVATITVAQDPAAVAPVRHRIEFAVTVLHCYARRAIDGDWQVSDVCFAHAAPAGLAEHRRIYGRVPRFGALRSGLSFTAALLGRPLRTRNLALAQLLEHLADRMLAELPSDTTVAAALRGLYLSHGFEHELTLELAARRLRLSPRTLQRRLREEGTSHNAVIDDARRSLASRLLTQSGLAIAEVAFALGFSEPGALHRAFKRWTGMTPAAFRRATRSG